jgi:hypothetical protein
MRKLLKRLSSILCAFTGLKAGVNENGWKGVHQARRTGDSESFRGREWSYIDGAATTFPDRSVPQIARKSNSRHAARAQPPDDIAH